MVIGAWVLLSILWLVQAVYGPAKTWLSIRLLRAQRDRFRQKGGGLPRKRVALIVAAKGVSPEFPRFLELVTHQDYPDYRLIFVTESRDDPAFEAMADFLRSEAGGFAPLEEADARQEEALVCRPGNEADRGLREVRLVVAGPAESSGQKVHNQLRAFRHLDPGDELIAFADSDIMGDRDWLDTLVMPLNLGEADGSTGYRWFFPRRDSLPNALATNINAGIATMTGPSWHTVLWGGSMALTRECFDEVEVPRRMEGSLNDDLEITAGLREQGKRIRFVRSLMAVSPVDYTWRSLFEFGRRQYFQLRVYLPGFWWSAFGLTSVWCAALLANVTALLLGRVEGGILIAVVILCDWLRSGLRGPYLRALFPGEERSALQGARRWEWWTTWLHMLVHWAIILSSVPIREINWAGIRYRIHGPKRVKVVSR